jgi:hypothetical protein
MVGALSAQPAWKQCRQAVALQQASAMPPVEISDDKNSLFNSVS